MTLGQYPPWTALFPFTACGLVLSVSAPSCLGLGCSGFCSSDGVRTGGRLLPGPPCFKGTPPGKTQILFACFDFTRELASFERNEKTKYADELPSKRNRPRERHYVPKTSSKTVTSINFLRFSGQHQFKPRLLENCEP